MSSSNEEKGIFQLPNCLKIQCSCSACDYRSCLPSDPLGSCNDCSLQSYYCDMNEIKDIVNQRIACKESNIDNRLLNVNSPLGQSSSTKELSSLILSLRNLDYENSLSHYSPGPVANIRNGGAIDLLQKLKEIYNACSCKVCECITGKSQRNQSCKCRPCQCDECISLRKNPTSGRTVQLYQTECLGKRFGKLSLKRNAKSELKTECDCKYCECVQCAADLIILPCGCKPCQCIECYPDRVLQNRSKIVTVNSDRYYLIERPPSCQIDRGLHLGKTSKLNEISTGIRRAQQCHCQLCFSDTCLSDTKDICSCKKRDRFLNKTAQRDKADFKLCRVLIKQNESCNDKLIMKPSINFVSNNINECKYSASAMPFNDLPHAISYSEFLLPNEKYSQNLSKSIDCDKMMAEDIYDCLNTKSESFTVEEEINKSEMLSNCMNRSLYREKNSRDSFPSKNLSTPILERHRKIELSKDDSVDKCGQLNSQTIILNKVQRLYKKINSNISLHENPHSRVKYVQYADTLNTATNAINLIRKKKLLSSYDPLTNSMIQPLSTYKLNNTRNSLQSDDNCKSRISSCNRSGHEDFNFFINFPKKIVTVDSAPINRKVPEAEKFNDICIVKNGFDNKLFKNYCNDLKTCLSSNFKKCLEKTQLTPTDIYNDVFKRVQKTLEDARQYSQQLVKLLEQFEKENREFVSACKIIQKSNTTQIGQHRFKEKCIFDTSKTINQDTELKVINYDMSTQDKHTGLYKNADWIHLQKDTVNVYVESKLPSKNSTTKECSFHSSRNHYDSQKAIGLDASLNLSISNSMRSNMITEDDDSYSTEHNNVIVKQNNLLYNQAIFLTKRIQSKSMKSYTKMYKRAITLSKRGKRFVPKVPRDSVTTEISDALDAQVNSSNHLPTAKMYSIENKREEAAIGDSQSCAITYRKIKNSEAKNRKFLQNFAINSEVERRTPAPAHENSSVIIFKTMSEIEALKSCYSQCQHDKCCKSDECKQNNLHANNQSLFQAKSYDALRVNLLTVKKVTDRKIMVMWNVPRSLKNVKGYELLVDGRMEWKIPNIYCGAVVVDCIPESNKILLTVRTVTISPSPSGHVPSTTIVYTHNKHNCRSLSNQCSSSDISLFSD